MTASAESLALTSPLVSKRPAIPLADAISVKLSLPSRFGSATSKLTLAKMPPPAPMSTESEAPGTGSGIDGIFGGRAVTVSDAPNSSSGPGLSTM